ncbi:MAG: hypothetical protein J6K62_01030 [Clostridia bacterium]|nr:hypothetical protein [Clostridia bacterium]
MHVVKGKKKSVLLRIALLALAVYIVASLVRLRVELNAREQVKQEVLSGVQAKKDQIVVLNDKLSNADNDVEQGVRENGMAKPGETILVEVPSED